MVNWHVPLGLLVSQSLNLAPGVGIFQQNGSGKLLNLCEFPFIATKLFFLQ
jgi:hypothetical protein